MARIEEHPAVRDLPIVDVLEPLAQAMRNPGWAVLVAPPGAGKTTVVPLALAEQAWVDGKVVMLEPRRLAARAAASRMARLLGEEEPGGRVGYRIRGETRVGSRTRIEVVTEGVLTRMLQSDPSLDGVAALLFDEFHERSVHADLGLALALHARRLLRPDLRVLVMSATLDPAPVADLMGEAPVITAEGQTYPVVTHWRTAPVESWIEPAVVRAVRRALDQEKGDILVFLPGAGEIRRTQHRLAGAGLPDRVQVHALFGALSRREQDRALAPSPAGHRKVVLATAIAETSLTIEGVTVVIDSGQMRVPRFDPGTGMTRLETVRVTRDSADQRRGRAGRTEPGTCYRLWTRAEDRGLVPRRQPEILESDLAPLALELAVWGAEPAELPWLDPPPEAPFAQALELLRELDAVDDHGATDHGRALARLGLHPRLGHMLLRGRDLGAAALACDLAAILGDRDFLQGEDRAPDADLQLRVEALRRASPGQTRRPGVHQGGLRRVRQEAERLRRALDRRGGRGAPGIRSSTGGSLAPGRRERTAHGADEPVRVGVLTALAYPDRIGQRRAGRRGQFLLRNGRGARFAETQSLEAQDWLVAAEVEGRGRDARIFRAAALTLEEIEEHFAGQVEEIQEIVWDPVAERVLARRRRMLGALALMEAPLTDPDPGALGRALLDGVREAGLRTLDWSKEASQLQQRLEFLGRRNPDWPDLSWATLEATLDDWLLPFLSGKKRLGEIRATDLTEALLARVGWDRREALERLAPTHLPVPSGSRIRIDYSDPEAPALAVRLQEVFGLTETPRIAGVPLTLRLLSPAQRPVQVTQDLASFWRDAYFEVRKDLRGRYPKHYWPEDPLEAEPTRRTRPKQ